jgi:prepilin-type N-terminal cleavage/methylation domain-containing protein
MNRKGFTLIELLVVIAILAVLAVAVTLILNPAELVRQGRDSTRLSDIGTVHRAIGLYFADQQEITFSAEGFCTSGTSASTTQGCTENATTTVDGNGWVPIDFTGMTTGSPLARLPLDPVNNSANFYVFVSDINEMYELNANMESTRYGNGGGDDVESTDGGDADTWYEVGNDSELNL